MAKVNHSTVYSVQWPLHDLIVHQTFIFVHLK